MQYKLAQNLNLMLQKALSLVSVVILVDFIQKNFIIFTIFFSPSLLNDGEKSVPGLNLINLPDFKETIETNIPKDKT